MRSAFDASQAGTSALRRAPLDLAAELGLPKDRGGGPSVVVAFVGGGGKTSAMFASAAAVRSARVIVTTTTHIRDPRQEAGRIVDRVFVDARLGTAPSGGANAAPIPVPGAGPLVVASGYEAGSGRLVGIHPSRIEELAAASDLVLVEADGSRCLPVKAPAGHEPAMPERADIVVGVVGLECLGAPMCANSVHRPELFGPLSGCLAGQAIGPEHIASLLRAPEGLFKRCPRKAKRVALFNKADAASPAAIQALLELISADQATVDLVLVCSLKYGELYAREAGPSRAAKGETR